MAEYPEEVKAYIYDHHSEYSARELSQELKKRFGFERTPKTIRAYCKNHNLRFKPKKGRIMPELSKYPVEMHAYIRDIAYGRSYKDIASMINRRFGDGTITVKQTRGYLKNHKIKTGRTGCFTKGHVPWTKGKTIEEILKDPEKIRRFYENQYKKGNVPHNALPLGTIIKNSDGYLIRKKQMEGSQWERWEMLHRAVWEEHNGPIPEGMMVAFKDGNTENCDIGNLILIDMAENVAMNCRGYRSEDPDLTVAALTMLRINKRVAELKDKKQKENGNV